MNMLGEEPPYLSVGTEVSAKYKGAFCEAKVRKVDRVVKCKVAFKLGFGSHTVLDNQIKGLLRVGANIEARHPEKKEFIEGTITKIQDCSQYTVVFDDGDITTLRRSALCLKSGRHFAESETLDQLPLTHPEHFGNPVVAGRRGSRRRLGSSDDSSGEEEVPRKGKSLEERETEIGKVVCVELGDKKKAKDNWFPGLVVAPNAQDTVRIRVKEEYLVRSFKDARYYTVPKKEATEFTREIGLNVDNAILKTAVEKALTFLDKDELPPHWDRDQLFSVINSDESDSDAGLDSDSSDDEPTEEKDHFVAQLYKFMDDRGTPINVCPSVCSRDLDLYKLFKLVTKLNGYNRVSNHNQWKIVSTKLGFGNSPGVVTQVKHAYKRFLHSFEDFNRKLGCTMVNHPRSGRSRSRGGRSLIRDKDRATPVNIKIESAVKREDEVAEELPTIVESKKCSGKEDETKVKVKTEEIKPQEKDNAGDGNSDNEPVRPVSTLRKKFPTLKASPRTKDDTVVVKRRAETRAESRTPATRPKRAMRENSLDSGKTSGEESVKVSRGPDDQRSTTRAKSKEDIVKQLGKKDTPDSRRGKSSSKSSDSEGSKKAKSTGSEDSKTSGESPKGKKQGPEDLGGKRCRKRRNTEGTAEDPPAARPCVARNKSIVVGDVLKVYYGTSKNPNGIYEAKVLDIEEDDSGEHLFLVHYAGWNSRYDEWVKRNKIAENLSWTSRRAKQCPTKGTQSGLKRKVPGGKIEPARSTTPSSITSSSSRTKSPATPINTRKRMMRRDRAPVPDNGRPRRTRRFSGHTEISVDSGSDTESESVMSESEAESKLEVTPFERSIKDTEPQKKRATMRTRPAKKLQTDTPEVMQKKRPRLGKKTVKKEKEEDDLDPSAGGSKEEEAESVIKIAESADNDEELAEVHIKTESDISPKGRDFDLNEIRSELKGIDKAVKVNPELNTSQESESRNDEKLEEEEVTSTEVELIEPVEQKPNSQDQVPVTIDLSKDESGTEIEEIPKTQPEEKEFVVEDVKEDIYEFKEPEPFEFQEVRRPIRIFDEVIERSPEKIISVKNVNLPNTPLKVSPDKKEVSPHEDSKGRFRKTGVKKVKEGCEEKKLVVEQEIKTEEENPVAPQLEVEVPHLPKVISPATHETVKPERGEGTSSAAHKPSPEPPCLVPVTEALHCQPPEDTPVLTREEPPPPPLPRLVSEISSSDSESEERLVIANDEESTSSDVKVDPLFVSSIASPPRPPLLVDERRETKRSPLSEIRLKRVEERLKSSLSESGPGNSNKESSAPELCPNSYKTLLCEVVESLDLEVNVAGPSLASGSGTMRSLVCDEVIPGSPAAKDPNDDIPFQPPAASVMENTPPTTPPTTPESNISSPREDRVGRLYRSIELSSMDNESSKSQRDSSEVDLDNETGQRNRGIKFDKRPEKEIPESPSKKKRSRKRSESNCETTRRTTMRGSAVGRGRRDPHASDSDDTSENSLGIHGPDPSLHLSNRSPRPSKYNFCKEMAPDMDGSQKIAYLQHQMQELRKAYMNVKSQLASIDRRRKKLRRKEREEKQAAAAAAAAAQAASAPGATGVSATKAQETS